MRPFWSPTVIPQNTVPPTYSTEPTAGVEIEDITERKTDSGQSLLDVVLRNASSADSLISKIEIRPVSKLDVHTQPPKGPLLETTALYSILLNASGAGKISATRLVVSAHKLERLLIVARLGTRVGDRVEAPLTADGDVVESVSGRFLVTITCGNQALSRELNLTVLYTFGEAQRIESTIPEQITALKSKDPATIDTAVDLFTAVPDKRACKSLTALRDGNLQFMKSAFSYQMPTGEDFEDPGGSSSTTDQRDEFGEFRKRLNHAIDQCCQAP